MMERERTSWTIDSARKQYGSGSQLHLPCFLGAKSCGSQDSPQKEALAELEEDERLDDGEVEIPSDQEFVG